MENRHELHVHVYNVHLQSRAVAKYLCVCVHCVGSQISGIFLLNRLQGVLLYINGQIDVDILISDGSKLVKITRIFCNVHVQYSHTAQNCVEHCKTVCFKGPVLFKVFFNYLQLQAALFDSIHVYLVTKYMLMQSYMYMYFSFGLRMHVIHRHAILVFFI